MPTTIDIAQYEALEQIYKSTQSELSQEMHEIEKTYREITSDYMQQISELNRE